jgi:CheY-like chemotaxis protein
LGLATVLGIVRRHYGFVDVQSEVGRGTCFSVYLPAAEQGCAEVGPASISLPPGQGELVLVVDDEASIRDSLQLMLQTWGYKVLTANDGAQALALYNGCRSEVALVLLDMMMPVLDGPTTLRALRCLDPKLRVIGLSGLPSGSKPEDLDGVPVDGYLAKPFTAQQLLLSVRQVLDGALA